MMVKLLLTIGLLFLGSTGMMAQFQYGIETKVALSRNVLANHTTDLAFSRSNGIGPTIKYTATSDDWGRWRRYNFDVGLSLSQVSGFANQSMIEYALIEMPLGISINLKDLYRREDEIVLGAKYLPSYFLELNEFGQGLQFEIGIAFFFDMIDKKPRQFEVVYFRYLQFSEQRDPVGNRSRFEMNGLSLRIRLVNKE